MQILIESKYTCGVIILSYSTDDYNESEMHFQESRITIFVLFSALYCLCYFPGVPFSDGISRNSCFCSNQMKKSTIVKRFYGTRTNKPLSSQHTANQFVRWLLPEERATLLSALKEFEVEDGISKQGERMPIYDDI